jgi:hypothetical protein
MGIYNPPRQTTSTGTGDLSGSYVTLDTDQTITGDKVFDGDVTFNGTVLENLVIEDNTIILNSGESGTGVTAGSAGIEVDRGLSGNSKLLFKENLAGNADNRWVIDIGDGTQEQILYDNIPDDVTLNGKLTVNNDLDVNFDLTVVSLAANTDEIVTLDANGKLIASGLTIADISGSDFDPSTLDTRFVNITGDTMTGPLTITYDGGTALQVNSDGDARIRLNNPAGDDVYSELAFANSGVDKMGLYLSTQNDHTLAFYNYDRSGDFLGGDKLSYQDNFQLSQDRWQMEASALELYYGNYFHLQDTSSNSIFYSDQSLTQFNGDSQDIDFEVFTAQGRALNVESSSTPANEYVEVEIVNDATSSLNGGFRIAGGAGVAKSLHVGTGIYDETLTPALSGNFLTWDGDGQLVDSGENVNTLVDDLSGSFVIKSGDTMTGVLNIEFAGAGSRINLLRSDSGDAITSNLGGNNTGWTISTAGGVGESAFFGVGNSDSRDGAKILANGATGDGLTIIKNTGDGYFSQDLEVQGEVIIYGSPSGLSVRNGFAEFRDTYTYFGANGQNDSWRFSRSGGDFAIAQRKSNVWTNKVIIADTTGDVTVSQGDVKVTSIGISGDEIVTLAADGTLQNSGETISSLLSDYNTRFVNITGDTMTGTLTMSGAGILFDPNGAPAHQEGLVYYDSDEKALTYYNEQNDMAIQIGQETVVRVVNKTGVDILNGQVVYINGAQGNRPTVALADADLQSSHNTIGLATHNIPNNQNGYITINGLVRDLNTSGFSEGDELWVSQVAGEFTNIEPTFPAHGIKIGTAVSIDLSGGSVLVNVSTNADFEDVHGVSISGASDGDLLVFNGVSGEWDNQTVVAATSGALDSRYVEVAGDTMTGALTVDLTGGNGLIVNAGGNTPENAAILVNIQEESGEAFAWYNQLGNLAGSFNTLTDGSGFFQLLNNGGGVGISCNAGSTLDVNVPADFEDLVTINDDLEVTGTIFTDTIENESTNDVRINPVGELIYSGGLSAKFREGLTFENIGDGILFASGEGGGQQRKSIFWETAPETLVVTNRAVNGYVELRASAGTGGAGDEMTVARVEDDRFSTFVDTTIVSLSGNTDEIVTLAADGTLQNSGTTIASLSEAITYNVSSSQSISAAGIYFINPPASGADLTLTIPEADSAVNQNQQYRFVLDRRLGGNVSVNIVASSGLVGGQSTQFIGQNNRGFAMVSHDDEWIIIQNSRRSQTFLFQSPEFENPNNSDWAVNALAPAQADTINAGLTVRAFDDTTEEGIGYNWLLPDWATKATISTLSRSVSGQSGDVVPNFYFRTLEPNQVGGDGLSSWSAAVSGAAQSMTSDGNWQYNSETFLLNDFGLGGTETQIFVEYTRDTDNPSDDLIGDWYLLSLEVSIE